MSDTAFAPPQRFTPCSFEKIYFSRGNDPQIYRERKAMGAALVPQVVESIGGAFEKTIFSFIPNTAETAYHGLMDGLRLYRRQQVRTSILEAVENGTVTPDLLDDLILRNWPQGREGRPQGHQDADLHLPGKRPRPDGLPRLRHHLRRGRNPATSWSRSMTRSSAAPPSSKSILKILARTKPAKIVVCSTAPQIRYPDCYGIDMSELGKFIAFQAAVALHRRAGRQSLLDRDLRRMPREN
jgi:amidophosphoribosyltransferase